VSVCTQGYLPLRELVNEDVGWAEEDDLRVRWPSLDEVAGTSDSASLHVLQLSEK